MLIDKFLEAAVEVDVDAICDGTATIIGGIMEHIEAAGVHSGDSACVLPPYSIGTDMIAQITAATKAMAAELKVVGLMNVQYAIKDNQPLRDRGQPPRVAHDSFCQQGHR